MRILALLAAFVPACWASALLPVDPATASIAVPAKTLNGASFHLEVRLHGQNWTSGQSANPMFAVGGYGIITGPSAISFTLPDQNTPGGGNCTIRVPGATDILIDITRDTTPDASYPKGLVRGEVFATGNGALYGSCVFAITSAATGAAIAGQGVIIGHPNATGAIGFIRWYPGANPAGAAVPVSVSTPAPWLDYEFTKDDVGNGRRATPGADTNSAGYKRQNLAGNVRDAATPAYKPVCNAGSPQTIAVGSALTLDGSKSYPVDGHPRLTYAWQYSGPGADGVVQNPQFSNPSAATSSVAGLIFGSFNARLTVTDSSGNKATCSVHNGAVPAAANGAINLAAEGLTPAQQFLIGPQVMFGRNPWPWADVAVLNELRTQQNNLQTGQFYSPFWRDLQPGTVTLTAGSSTVEGTGTKFKSLFCAGGNKPASGAQLIWKYKGVDGRAHYTYSPVTSCQDDSHLTLKLTYPASPKAPWPSCSRGCPGLSFAAVDDSSGPYNHWLYNPAPANYYDNVMFFLAGYWRSGIDSFYDAAKTLATYWMEWPFLDSYYNCGPYLNNLNPDGSACLGETRSYSVTGMALWEQQPGNAYLLPAMENLGAYFLSYTGNLPSIMGLDDMRNDAYALSGLAVLSMIETNAGPKETYRKVIRKSLTSVWTPFRRTTPYIGWNQFYFGHSTSITAGEGCASCSVTASTGSNVLVGSGTRWDSSMVGQSIWTFPPPANTLPAFNAPGGDAHSYVVVAVDAARQALTLSEKYAGTTNLSRRGFSTGGTSGITGWGVQPFMMGHLAQAFYFAAHAMAGYDDAAEKTFLGYGHDAVNFVVNDGITPDQGGLYNGTWFPGCKPPMFKTSTQAQLYCYGATEYYPRAEAVPSWENRQLATEVMRALAFDYQNFGTHAAVANALMSQMFSKPGTGSPNPDGAYLVNYEANISNLAKWTGQLNGYTEGAGAWPGLLAAVSGSPAK